MCRPWKGTCGPVRWARGPFPAEDMMKKVKKITEMFVQDLARIQGGTVGGTTAQQVPPGCPNPTCFVCGEEPKVCIGC